MTVQDPSVRPDAATVLAQWLQIRGHVSTLHRVARARKRSEGIVTRIIFDAFALLKLGGLLPQKLIRSVGGLAVSRRRV